MKKALILICLAMIGCSQLKTANLDPTKTYEDGSTFLLVRIHAQQGGDLGIWKPPLTKIAQLEQDKMDQIRLIPAKVAKGTQIFNYAFSGYVATFSGINLNLEPGTINYIGDIYIDLAGPGGSNGISGIVPGQTYAKLTIKNNEQETVSEAAKVYTNLFNQFPTINKIPTKTQDQALMNLIPR